MWVADINIAEVHVGETLAYLDQAGGWDYSLEAARSGAAHAYVYGHSPATRNAVTGERNPYLAERLHVVMGAGKSAPAGWRGDGGRPIG